jgi:hypothetical protein
MDNINTVRKNTEASSEVGVELNTETLSIWLCLITKMQDKIIIYWQLKIWHSSSNLEL